MFEVVHDALKIIRPNGHDLAGVSLLKGRFHVFYDVPPMYFNVVIPIRSVVLVAHAQGMQELVHDNSHRAPVIQKHLHFPLVVAHVRSATICK